MDHRTKYQVPRGENKTFPDSLVANNKQMTEKLTLTLLPWVRLTLLCEVTGKLQMLLNIVHLFSIISILMNLQ